MSDSHSHTNDFQHSALENRYAAKCRSSESQSIRVRRSKDTLLIELRTSLGELGRGSTVPLFATVLLANLVAQRRQRQVDRILVFVLLRVQGLNKNVSRSHKKLSSSIVSLIYRGSYTAPFVEKFSLMINDR